MVHEFNNNGICSKCGSGKDAAEAFGFKCKPSKTKEIAEGKRKPSGTKEVVEGPLGSFSTVRDRFVFWRWRLLPRTYERDHAIISLLERKRDVRDLMFVRREERAKTSYNMRIRNLDKLRICA